MNQDILLSKIVASPTDIKWSQAYTTLNVYITLSLTAKEGSSITSLGKDTLEKLQREFFAVDEKNLDNIKKAVGNVVKTLDGTSSFSIIVGALSKNILYIVIASEGQVLIKRGTKTGVIAQGEENEVIGFSGKLQSDDTVIFETADFNTKIPLTTLEESLTNGNVTQIAEDVTPLVHEGATGGEAAIIIQYKDTSIKASPTPGEEEVEQEDEVNNTKETVLPAKDIKEEEIEEKTEGPIESLKEENDDDDITKRDDIVSDNLWTKPPQEHYFRDSQEGSTEEGDHFLPDEKKSNIFVTLASPLKNARIPQLPGKKGLILVGIVLLVVILVGSIGYQNYAKQRDASQKEFAAVYTPAQQKYDEATSFDNLDKSVALSSLQEAQKMITDNIAKFKKGSKEEQQLSALLSQINAKIEEIGGGSTVENQQTLFSKNSDFPNIDGITYAGGDLVIASSQGKKVGILSDKKISESFDTEDDSTVLASDDKYIYALGANVVRIDKGNGNTETILDDAKGSAIGIFGSNYYLLEGDDVLKYRTPSTTSTSYFTSKPNFSSNPQSFAIDGSIWILEQNGTIDKFTKGVKDSFEIQGLLSPIGSGATIYTAEDFENLYVLDPENKRVVVFSKNGEYINQFEGTIFSNANTFTVDESSKTGYIVGDNTVYSFDM